MGTADQRAKYNVITSLGRVEAQLEILDELQPYLHPDVYWKKRKVLLVEKAFYAKVITMAVTL